ncbi:MAG: hypothetical protein KKE09_19530 [Bacteroidetes bacterium]|nr:hypothetical protein [Bacteroidota bacterium]
MNKDIEILKSKLAHITALAKTRKENGEYCFKVNDHMRYVRISTKFRAVSLDRENPCGHLLNQQGKKINGTKKITTAINHARSELNKNHKPGNQKPEHQVQAFIIWQAITCPNELPTTLGIKEKFDSLLYVTDELSLNDIRADIVLLGVKGSRCHPVLIELKKARNAKVAKQLDAAKDTLEKVESEFRQFLEAATGLQVGGNFLNFSRVIIWGKSLNPRKDTAEKIKDYLAIQYEKVNDEFRFSVESP